MKEYRVYVLDTDDEYEVGANDIESWNLYQIAHPGHLLPQAAADFITKCEELGTVYSLYEFVNEFNRNICFSGYSFIFITNNYE